MSREVKKVEEPEKKQDSKKTNKPFTIIGETYFENGELKFKETRLI